MLSTAMVLLASLGADGAEAVAPDLAPGIKLEAAGKPIDVEVGHAAPWYADFDGDGIKDLLVGQFGGGKLRIYRNTGTDAQPKFEEHKFFQAAGADATVPFG